MHRTEQGWTDAYKVKRAYFVHNGKSSQRHVVLRSKKHSAGFFYSRPITDDPEMLLEVAEDLAEHLLEMRVNIGLIQVVVGPATGATKLAEAISQVLSRITGKPCDHVSPKKETVDGVEVMTFTPEQADKVNGKFCLLCEDVLTTGASVDKAVVSLIEAGGTPLPFICVIVNRSGKDEVNGRRIIPLVTNPMPMWDNKETCRLCSEGSEPLENPKDNWDLLNAD